MNERIVCQFSCGPTVAGDRYALPGAQPAPSLASNDVSLISEGKTQPAQSVKDVIIDDLQSQFDTEGITRNRRPSHDRYR